MRRLLLAAALIATASPAFAGDNRIVNGTVVPEGEYPETVYLQISGIDGGGNCTGTLINPEWVLTAAHCIEDGATGINVSFGTEGATNPTDSVDAIAWKMHPDYIPKSGVDVPPFEDIADIALVQLGAPYTRVLPVGLNGDAVDDSWIGLDLQMVGYGITEWQGGGSGTKRTVPDTIISYTDSELDTFSNGAGSTCQGDSGGPGFLFDSVGGYVQVTVTSRGVQCGEGTSTYTRVDSFLDWLDEEGVVYSTGSASPPSFVCSNRIDDTNPDSQAVGVVPFDLRCVVDATDPDALSKVEWSWGDGTSSEGTEVAHEYTTDGNFTVRMCASGNNVFGEWTHCVPRQNHVLACGLPEVDLSIEVDDGLTMKFVNLTDIGTYGCIYNVQWDIFAGTSASGEPIDSIQAWEPQYTFPEKGEYTVVLNVGGMAGTSAAQIIVEASPRNQPPNPTCASLGSSTPAFGFVSLLGLALVARRRRTA